MREHIPDIALALLALAILYILYLHWQERNGSNQRVAPRPSDIARLQILDQTRSAIARRNQIRAGKQ
jgi:hypothetical protein